MFSRILVATDFSNASDEALDCAKALATKLGSSLHLLHVIADPIAYGAFGTDAYVAESPEYTENVTREAERRLAMRITPAERGDLHASTEVAAGPYAQVIIDTARARGIELIVMGTHGRTGLAHAVLGSVAERVVRQAPCPVLTIHARRVAEKPERHQEPGVMIL